MSVGNFNEVARARRGMIGMLSAYAISESTQDFGINTDFGITTERASRASLGWADEGVCPYVSGLDVQVLYVEGVFLDELAA